MFGRRDWVYLKDALDILPMGLTRIELRILELLKDRPRTLTNLGAVTGLSKPSLQNDHELFLLKADLMEIEVGGRRITAKGLEYLKKFGSKFS
jgi:Holliday junction resolvasome RuvABC ATP-dependent DNA helicase subunit